jgi:hypothetical protein
MIFTKEQKNEAYKKLSPEVQSFIMEGETTELIINYLKELRLSEDQLNLVDSEILYSMFGLQTLSDAINNIAKLTNKNVNDFSELKINLEKNIFSKIQEKIEIPETEFNKNKVVEIGKKYSLNENQIDKLINILAEINTKTKNSDVLIATIINNLEISELLVKQILKDLDDQVFQYATDFISQRNKNENKTEITPAAPVVPAVKPTPKIPQSILNIFKKQQAEVEMPPVILPMVESDEERKKVLEQNKINENAPIKLIEKTVTKTPEIAKMPEIKQNPTQEGTFVGSEFIQKPIAVPRFNASAENVVAAEPKITASPKPQNIIDAKLNSIVNSKDSVQKQEVQNPPRYTNDPYREPIN